MSAFDSQGVFGPPLFGAYGMGMGVAAVVVDRTATTNASNGAIVPAKDIDPLERPYTPYGFAGQWSGFGPFPLALTLMTAVQMRDYPMIRKVYKRITEPLLAGKRIIEIVDDNNNPELAQEILKAATATVLPMLDKAMPGALESMHFGYWLHEVVWAERDGRQDIADVISIQPAQAQPYVDQYRKFKGFMFAGQYRDASSAFIAVNDEHLDPVLGRSNNASALVSWFRATQSAQNADAIEKKASGIQLILHIMEGSSFTDPDTGVTLTFKQLAQRWMKAAVRGESITVPAYAFSKEAVQAKPEIAAIPHVRADRFDWGNQGPNLEAHLNRKRELDVEICSTWGVPERAVMESSHGDKGDASEHADVVDCISENVHARVCRQWDDQPFARWMAINYRDSGIKLKTTPLPLQDPDKKFKQSFVLAAMANQECAAEILAQVDKRKAVEGVELPLVSEKDAATALAKSEQQQKDAADAKTKQMTQANGKQAD